MAEYIMMKNRLSVYAKLFRAKHWIKNLIVFIPGICGQRYVDIQTICISFFIFVEFCLCASSIYILNDLADVEVDKHNPRKRNTPIVSGAVSKRKAKIIALVLIVLTVFVALIIYQSVGLREFLLSQLFIFIYFVLNILYSKLSMKDIPVIELLIVVVGYILRLDAGGLIIKTPISRYLLLTIGVFSLYMILCKRFYELQSGMNTRKVLEKYSVKWLGAMKNLSCGLGIVYYSFWAMEMFDSTIAAWLILGIVVLVLIYSYDTEKTGEGDPISIIYNDKWLVLLGVGYLLVLMLVQMY